MSSMGLGTKRRGLVDPIRIRGTSEDSDRDDVVANGRQMTTTVTSMVQSAAWFVAFVAFVHFVSAMK